MQIALHFRVLVLQLTRYALQRADFNMGQTVYEKNVQISKIKDRLYKISSSDGEKTFRTDDFLTMIGPMVEFAAFDRDPNVRCLFDDLTTAQNLYRDLKPDAQVLTVEVTIHRILINVSITRL